MGDFNKYKKINRLMMNNDYDNKIEKKIILETSDETRVITSVSSQLKDEVFIVFYSI